MACTQTAAADLKQLKKAKMIAKNGTPRGKKKNGYSGELAALTAYLSFYDNLIE
jgi:hypothetical protein